jgi:NADH dehydrogenase
MSAKREFPDAYGKTKLKIEKLIEKSGINYTILRPSIVYGKGSTSFDFMINYIKKIPFFTPIIGTGKYKLSPVHIKDVVWCIDKCIKNKKADKKDYDIVGGEKVYFIDLVDELKKEIGVKKINIRVPLFFCRIIAIILPKLISKENLINLTQDSIANLDQAKKDLHYKPMSFKAGRKNGLI